MTDPGDAFRALGEAAFEDETVALVTRVFEVDRARPFTFADGEVERAERVVFDDLPAWIDAHEIVPDTLAVGVPLLRPRPRPDA